MLHKCNKRPQTQFGIYLWKLKTYDYSTNCPSMSLCLISSRRTIEYKDKKEKDTPHAISSHVWGSLCMTCRIRLMTKMKHPCFIVQQKAYNSFKWVQKETSKEFYYLLLWGSLWTRKETGNFFALFQQVSLSILEVF